MNGLQPPRNWKWATAAELEAILGAGWAVCRSTPKNVARYGRCVTRKQYREATNLALRQRQAAMAEFA